MRRSIIMLVIVGLSVILLTPSLTPPLSAQGAIKDSGLRVVLVSGNKLYEWCSAAERTVQVDRDSIRFTGSSEDQHVATYCFGYVEGVIDTTPVGGEFSPGKDVLISQYIDVVTNYLKSHANIRDEPAAGLVQDSLREAFPHTAAPR